MDGVSGQTKTRTKTLFEFANPPCPPYAVKGELMGRDFGRGLMGDRGLERLTSPVWWKRGKKLRCRK